MLDGLKQRWFSSFKDVDLSRRGFLKNAAFTAGTLIVVPQELILPEPTKTYFLPPKGGWIQSYDDFRPVIMPIIRRVFPSLLAQQIVGVQSMMAPESKIFSMALPTGNVFTMKDFGDQVLLELKANMPEDKFTIVNTLLDNQRKYVNRQTKSS